MACQTENLAWPRVVQLEGKAAEGSLLIQELRVHLAAAQAHLLSQQTRLQVCTPVICFCAAVSPPLPCCWHMLLCCC